MSFSKLLGGKLFRITAILLLIAIVLFAVTLFSNEPTVAPTGDFQAKPADMEEPEINGSVVVSELNKPWGIDFYDDEKFIFVERAGSINVFDGEKALILETPSDLDARGEGGLLGVTVDPEFETNNYIYVCYTTESDVRVNRWVLNKEQNGLSDQQTIVDDMPVAKSGRHSGCRPDFGPDGYLWIATGDAAIGTTPQDPQSLGGKILRVDRDGQPAPDNIGGEYDPRVYSYGHRNSQGIAFAEDKSYIGFSAEHGPDVDDEINILSTGNFGWNPVPGYNESVLMTDTIAYPDAVRAAWKSGKPTVALSGATFVYGEEWKAMDGRLLVATLKAKKVLMFDVSDSGELENEAVIFDDQFGRIRSVEQSPSGSLYITTDNGDNKDQIIKFSPSS